MKKLIINSEDREVTWWQILIRLLLLVVPGTLALYLSLIKLEHFDRVNELKNKLSLVKEDYSKKENLLEDLLSTRRNITGYYLPFKDDTDRFKKDLELLDFLIIEIEDISKEEISIYLKSYKEIEKDIIDTLSTIESWGGEYNKSKEIWWIFWGEMYLPLMVIYYFIVLYQAFIQAQKEKTAQ